MSMTEEILEVLIGKYLDEKTLGIYERANKFLLFPLNNFTVAVQRVLFPGFSSIQNDEKQIKEIFLLTSQAIALITFPLMMWIFVNSTELVTIIFGNQWLPMVPILDKFCFISLPQILLTLNSTIFLSKGRPDIPFKIGVFTKTIFLIMIIVGIKLDGMTGLINGMLIATYINFFPLMHFMDKLINLNFTENMKIFFPVLLITLGSTSFIIAFKSLKIFEDTVSLITSFFINYIIVYVIATVSDIKSVKLVQNYILNKAKKKMILN